MNFLKKVPCLVVALANMLPGQILQKKSTTLYKVDVDSSTSLALFTYGTPERPMLVSQVRGDKGEIFWFTGWGHVPFDPTLFARPDGVKIEDQKR